MKKLFFSLLSLFLCQLTNLHGADVTASVELLGNPTEGSNLRDRNQSVWDLQVFEGRVYLGGGNTTVNPGRNDIWAYHPATEKFVNEFDNINSEAIEVLRVIDDRLYVPASDPASGDSMKFYYRDLGGTWKSVSSSPNMAHIRDVAKTGGKLLSVGNTRDPDNIAGLVLSDKNGGGMDQIQSTNSPRYIGYAVDNFFYSILNYAGQTFVTGGYFDYTDRIEVTYGPNYNFQTNPNDYTSSPLSGIAVYNPATEKLSYDRFYDASLVDQYVDDFDFLPSTPPAFVNQDSRIFLRFFSTAQSGNVLAYALRGYSLTTADDLYHKEYQNNHGLYIKTSLQSPPIAAAFPGEPDVIGEDVFVKGGVFYALANRKITNNSFVVSVWRSATPQNNETWEKLFHFSSAGRAKSFEYLGGDFYFGLGADNGENTTPAGRLLRVAHPVESVYQKWRSGTSWATVPVAERDSVDDPDGDGITNLEELIFGTDPTKSEPIRYPLSETLKNGDGTTTITLRYPKTEPTALCVMTFSTSLAPDSWFIGQTTEESFDPATMLYSQTYKAPAGTGRFFARLEVRL